MTDLKVRIRDTVRELADVVGMKDLFADVDITEDGEIFYVWFRLAGIGVSNEYMYSINSILGLLPRRGFRIWAVHTTPATRHHPGDSFDITLAEEQTFDKACIAAVVEVVRYHLEQAMEHITESTGNNHAT